MCEPVAIVSAVAAVAGAALQYQGAQQARNAQEEASNQAAAAAMREQQRQDEISGRSREQAGRIAQESGPQAMQERLRQAEARRAEGLTAATAEDTPNQDRLGGQQGASDVVRTVISDRQGEARAKLAREALARARLGSWGDAFVNLGETTAPMQDRIGMFGSFARGSAGASGVEQQAAEVRRNLAQYEGAGLRAIGSGVSALGNAGLSNAGTVGSWFGTPMTGRIVAEGTALGAKPYAAQAWG